MWDITCTDTFAPSFVTSTGSPGGREEKAKYRHLDTLHMFVPFVVETTGVFGRLTCAFLNNDCRVFLATGEQLSLYHLYSVSVTIQRGNATQ